MRNLADNDIELEGWGSEIQLSNKVSENGESMVAQREIGKQDVDAIADYLTFLEWQFKGDKSDSSMPRRSGIEGMEDDDVEIVYLAGDSSDDSDYSDDEEETEIEVIAVSDKNAQLIAE